MQEKSFHAGEQHPEEWRRDLNPDANAGINYGQAGEDGAQAARTGSDIKELYDALPDFSKEELKQIPTVSGSLREALENLDKDREFLLAGGVFENDQIDSYIELKMTEVIKFEHTPHPVEYEMYYSA